MSQWTDEQARDACRRAWPDDEEIGASIWTVEVGRALLDLEHELAGWRLVAQIAKSDLEQSEARVKELEQREAQWDKLHLTRFGEVEAERDAARRELDALRVVMADAANGLLRHSSDRAALASLPSGEKT